MLRLLLISILCPPPYWLSLFCRSYMHFPISRCTSWSSHNINLRANQWHANILNVTLPRSHIRVTRSLFSQPPMILLLLRLALTWGDALLKAYLKQSSFFAVFHRRVSFLPCNMMYLSARLSNRKALSVLGTLRPSFYLWIVVDIAYCLYNSIAFAASPCYSCVYDPSLHLWKNQNLFRLSFIRFNLNLLFFRANHCFFHTKHYCILLCFVLNRLFSRLCFDLSYCSFHR